MNKFLIKPKPAVKFWDFYRDGVSQSLIQKWLQCREQCRLEYSEGWTKLQQPLFFKFGTCVHWVLAEIYTSGEYPSKEKIVGLIRKYERNYLQKNVVNSADQAELDELFMFAELLLERYFLLHEDDFNHKWLHVEKNFEVEVGKFLPYKIRGRWDGVFEESDGSISLIDHKCLSLIDEAGISDMLPCDMQVMVYLYAARQKFGRMPKQMIYNILRRPGFRQGKKTELEFRQHIILEMNKKLEYFFIRIPIRITEYELDDWFENQLYPILCGIQVWYDNDCKSYVTPGALITKYGRCAMFDAITKSDFSGLKRRQFPFEELDGEDA